MAASTERLSALKANICLPSGTVTSPYLSYMLFLVLTFITVTAHRIAKLTRAIGDFCRLLELSTDTDESESIIASAVSRLISLDNVSFSYFDNSRLPSFRTGLPRWRRLWAFQSSAPQVLAS